MITRILWGFVALATVFVVSVFVFPSQADEFADSFGFKGFNETLRELKDSSSEDVRLPQSLNDLNTGSGIMKDARDIVTKTQSGIIQTKATIHETQTLIETKVEQARRVGESVEKTTQAIGELRTNVNQLTTLTGSSSSGSTASGQTSTGTTIRR